MNNMKETNLALDIQGVGVSYGKEIFVIQDVTLQVPKGEIFGLIGLNGAGKTTLIKTLLGLREPNDGSVRVFDQVRSHPQARQSVAYLPERFEPPCFLTGMEFVSFSLSLYKKKMEESEVLEMADSLALARDALYRRVDTYSKGMRQKVGLMGTLLTGCPLLVLDEPMSGLDPKARILVKEQIVKAHKQGRSIFLSSHILSDMDEICDRVGVIHNSRLCFVGEPSKLHQQTNETGLERAFLRIIEQNDAPSKLDDQVA